MSGSQTQEFNMLEMVKNMKPKEKEEVLQYLQKITSNVSTSDTVSMKTLNTEGEKIKKAAKHKCKNIQCVHYYIKHFKKIVCLTCKKQFDNEFQLYDHETRKHLHYPLSCLHCACSFRKWCDYDAHRSSCGGARTRVADKYRCAACAQTFTSKRTFHAHLFERHGTKYANDAYGCTVCAARFAHKRALHGHYKSVHADMKCRVRVEKPAEQNEEDTNTNDEETNKYQCAECNKTFARKSMLRCHVKCHLKSNLYCCECCQIIFKKYKLYKSHIQTLRHRQNDGRAEEYVTFPCVLCKKVYPNLKGLRAHSKIHTRPTVRHKCLLCEYETVDAQRLKRHTELHTDNRKLICHECGSCFRTSSALREHVMYLHSDVRNNSCEICGQQFKLKSGLNRHMKSHTDVKPFVCFFCDQTYKFRTNLTRHLKNAHNVKKTRKGTRVTTEESGYAVNVPVKSRKPRTAKVDNALVVPLVSVETPVTPVVNSVEPAVTNAVDEFDDIPSLSALTDVDLCADDVLRETNLASILAPMVDSVLQGAKTMYTTECYEKPYYPATYGYGGSYMPEACEAYGRRDNQYTSDSQYIPNNACGNVYNETGTECVDQYIPNTCISRERFPPEGNCVNTAIDYRERFDEEGCVDTAIADYGRDRFSSEMVVDYDRNRFPVQPNCVDSIQYGDRYTNECVSTYAPMQYTSGCMDYESQGCMGAYDAGCTNTEYGTQESSMMCDYGREFADSQYMQDMQMTDETSFSYTRWLQQIA